MRLRKVKNAREELRKCPLFIENPVEYKGKWQDCFQNNHPIHLEIGMGKGKYIIDMALQYPNINFIGMEKYESVLVRATNKVLEMDIPNIRFIQYDASTITEIFDHEIDTIYLNFSDPWPKKKHTRRRLTADSFLDSYELICRDKCHIIQKTDNSSLFEYSLEQYQNHGFTIIKISNDLLHTDIFNITTEYEDKFNHLGVPIHYVEVIK